MNYQVSSILFIFIFYSFLGWLLESIFGSIRRKKLVNRGFLYGPFCPIYGFGVVLLIIATNNFLNNILLLFIFSTLIISLLEYTTGFALEALFNATWWDYSTRHFNIKGRICLSFSLLWGLLSVAFLKFINPHTITIYKYIDNFLGITIIYLIVFYMALDFIFTLIHTFELTKRLNQINALYDDFLVRFEDTGENIEKVKAELKARYNAIFDKITEEFPRVFAAFPKFSNKIMRKIRRL